MISPEGGVEATVERSGWGRTEQGEEVALFRLRNPNGLEMRVTEYGAAIVSLQVPDREGRLADVVLGYDDLQGYVGDRAYLGVVIGRYANRIRNGRFELDGTEYQLATNDGPNHLHGGPRGFHKVLWSGEPFRGADGVGVRLTHTSPDGYEGYPGTLRVSVTYTLTDRDELVIDYAASADQATPVSLTQHSYFNLTGDAAREVLDHEIRIVAAAFTPTDPTLIPTGEFRPVAGTPFDFTRGASIGARIEAPDEQLGFAGGYDHNFVLDRNGGELALAARLYEPSTGRVMEVLTSEPGLQFYSGNFLDGSIRGKGGVVYGYRCGLCLETQSFPDSPNQPRFPSATLRPGEDLRSRTVYRFSAQRT